MNCTLLEEQYTLMNDGGVASDCIFGYDDTDEGDGANWVVIIIVIVVVALCCVGGIALLAGGFVFWKKRQSQMRTAGYDYD
jgi:hypothetical protein